MEGENKTGDMGGGGEWEVGGGEDVPRDGDEDGEEVMKHGQPGQGGATLSHLLSPPVPTARRPPPPSLPGVTLVPPVSPVLP